MENKIHINDLLEKFKIGTLSSNELKELYDILNNPTNPDLNNLFTQVWEQASFNGDETDFEKMFAKIKRKAGIPAPLIIKTPNRFVSVTKQISRYAAIFILAFALAWLLKPFKKDSSVSDNIGFYKIKVAYGSKSTVELPDSSIVILNSGSTLTYPGHFEKDSRAVSLLGEGFFEVKKNSKCPFYVNTNGLTVKVLGTKFNVKCYPDEKIIETTLVSGSIEILDNKPATSIDKPSITPIFLKPNQKAVFMNEQYARDNSLVSFNDRVTIQDNVQTDLFVSWKKNVLIFSNDSFSDIINKLERWYNVKIILKKESLAVMKFSGKFDGESVTEVLDALTIIQPFKYVISKNNIIIN